MELTINEKRVIYQILILIMEADLVIMPQEVEFLDKVFADFGLSIEEFDHMEGIEFDELKEEFVKFDADKKLYAKDLFMGMAACDGYVDPREVDIINKMCNA